MKPRFGTEAYELLVTHCQQHVTDAILRFQSGDVLAALTRAGMHACVCIVGCTLLMSFDARTCSAAGGSLCCCVLLVYGSLHDAA